jgi:hypothetical protein
MENENKQWGPPLTDAELDKINGITGKPEGLTPEQSQHWDDVEHDRLLMIKEGVFAKGFRLWGKGSIPPLGPLKRRGIA